MTVQEAAAILKAMYHSAPKGDTAVNVHLFGIKYAEGLRDLSLHEIVAAAGISETYKTEIRKGMNLSRYVQLKNSN